MQKNKWHCSDFFVYFFKANIEQKKYSRKCTWWWTQTKCTSHQTQKYRFFIRKGRSTFLGFSFYHFNYVRHHQVTGWNSWKFLLLGFSKPISVILTFLGKEELWNCIEKIEIYIRRCEMADVTELKRIRQPIARHFNEHLSLEESVFLSDDFRGKIL